MWSMNTLCEETARGARTRETLRSGVELDDLDEDVSRSLNWRV